MAYRRAPILWVFNLKIMKVARKIRRENDVTAISKSCRASRGPNHASRQPPQPAAAPIECAGTLATAEYAQHYGHGHDGNF